MESGKASKMFKKRAFYHWYDAEGETKFHYAGEVVKDLIQQYKIMETLSTNEQEGEGNNESEDDKE